MATLTVSGAIIWTGDNLSEQLSLNATSEPAGNNIYKAVQPIPTADTALNFGAVGFTPMYAVFRNLDAVNTVHIGPDSGGAIVEAEIINPGETTSPKRMATTTWRAIAQNDTVELLIVLFPA